MYNQGLRTIIHRHLRCSCSCFPLNLTSSVTLCWCISSSLSHSFASISIRRQEVPHSCSQLWSRLWCFAFYGSSNVTLEPVFCTPGEGSCCESSLPGKSQSANWHCPQDPHYCAKPPVNCQHRLQALVYNIPERICLKTVFMSMRQAAI